MARIAGVDIPSEKKLFISLQYIYGIGPYISKQILDAVHMDGNMRVKDMSEKDIAEIRQYIEGNVPVEGELRKEISLAIKRLVEINCYRGVRHKMSLPCRGQKTRSNARTRRGMAGKRGIKRK